MNGYDLLGLDLQIPLGWSQDCPEHRRVPEIGAAYFEEGIKLSRFCHTKLESAERRVEILLKNNSGPARAVPFESENEQ